jgi:hypothetical protein
MHAKVVSNLCQGGTPGFLAIGGNEGFELRLQKAVLLDQEVNCVHKISEIRV